MLFDGHYSYLSIEALKFCIAYKIILLYLLLHIIHLLQPLNISIFELLVQKYRSEVYQQCQFKTTYSIDKVDFLNIYQKVHI